MPGFTEADLLKLAQALKQLGVSVEVDPEELEAYYPHHQEGWYYPDKPLPAYDGKTLRGLSTVNSGVFRRLLGIRDD